MGSAPSQSKGLDILYTLLRVGADILIAACAADILLICQCLLVLDGEIIRGVVGDGGVVVDLLVNHLGVSLVGHCEAVDESNSVVGIEVSRVSLSHCCDSNYPC